MHTVFEGRAGTTRLLELTFKSFAFQGGTKRSPPSSTLALLSIFYKFRVAVPEILLPVSARVGKLESRNRTKREKENPSSRGVLETGLAHNQNLPSPEPC